MPTALITGVTGQDGSYLAELLLAKGYRVVGVTRDPGAARSGWLAPIADRIDLVQGDLRDGASLALAVRRSLPDEVYHLAAETVVDASWADPVATGDVTGLGAVRLLEAVHQEAPTARTAIACSSEVFGAAVTAPQDEGTPLRPRSPYGAAKAYALHMARLLRERHGRFICAGVLFNHESPRRPIHFVTRKVSDAAARIALGRAETVRLGDLDARRDWGFAPDYMDAMWRMLQADIPADYVVGSGRTHTVRELCASAFGAVGLDWGAHVVEDDQLKRPPEPVPLQADASRAHDRLGWSPTIGFDALVRLMVEADLARHRGIVPAVSPVLDQ